MMLLSNFEPVFNQFNILFRCGYAAFRLFLAVAIHSSGFINLILHLDANFGIIMVEDFGMLSHN